jgi:hypothetical protein
MRVVVVVVEVVAIVVVSRSQRHGNDGCSNDDVPYDSINEAAAFNRLTFKKAQTKHIVVNIQRVGCSCTESPEQSRTEQSRAEQSRAEQSRADQSRADGEKQSKTKQSTPEKNSADQKKHSRTDALEVPNKSVTKM